MVTLNRPRRNVVDYMKYWKNDAIVAYLDKQRHNFSVLCMNIEHDINLAGIIRNANAFLAKEIILFGYKRYNRVGCVGAYKYCNFRHFFENQLAELSEYLKDKHLVAVDNVPSAQPIDTFVWPKDKHVVMVMGQESAGIPQEILDLCDSTVYIRQYGTVRSLNVACASGIVMQDWCSKNVKHEIHYSKPDSISNVIL